ncbi:MAG: hypothetical protein GXO15_04285 [Crenarchaeota archaeon]|nr:hypothetical protein [Thermoproteota archaeon]
MAASEERRRLLREVIKAIEEDVELRYTLMGLLGFRELLERFTRLGGEAAEA